MIHGGGWKKMLKLMINNSQFKKESKNKGNPFESGS